MKIFLDAGHGGTDPGAVGFGKTKESDIVLDIALKLGGMLTGAGHTVQYSRTGDVSVSLSDRANRANDFCADVFVSIHCNSTKKVPDVAKGIETYSYPSSGKSAIYASEIQKKLVTALGLANRGAKTANFAVLRETDMPAILIETAFINNPDEEKLLQDISFRQKTAEAIFEGLTGEKTTATKEVVMEQTVMRLDNIWVQEINPDNFSILQCDCTKRGVSKPNYFNLGYFATLAGGGTIPVGNLMIDGKILSQSKDNASWINVAGKKLATIYTTIDGQAGITKTSDLSTIANVKTAVSGIPIIVGGKRMTEVEIKAEGYFGNELYDTWHGFLGLRHDKLVYVAMKCSFSQMVWNLVALGIYDAIKLDGGGSFILKNGKELIGTSENRRINNVGVWE